MDFPLCVPALHPCPWATSQPSKTSGSGVVGAVERGSGRPTDTCFLSCLEGSAVTGPGGAGRPEATSRHGESLGGGLRGHREPGPWGSSSLGAEGIISLSGSTLWVPDGHRVSLRRNAGGDGTGMGLGSWSLAPRDSDVGTPVPFLLCSLTCLTWSQCENPCDPRLTPMARWSFGSTLALGLWQPHLIGCADRRPPGPAARFALLSTRCAPWPGGLVAVCCFLGPRSPRWAACGAGWAVGQHHWPWPGRPTPREASLPPLGDRQHCF